MVELPAPMKAVAGDLPVDEDGWAYEIKWDGMRVVVGIDDAGLRAVSTRGLDAAVRFPELDGLVEHLAGHDVVLDGEMVAFEGDRSDFSKLQQRMHIASRAEAIKRMATTPAVFVVFDLLHLDGIDTMALPYEDRRRILTELVEPGPCWQVPAHRVGDGQALLEAARAAHLEGLIAKRLGSPYQPGKRSPSWRKIKIRRAQELVVGGWSDGTGSRSHSHSFGGLLLGYHTEPSDGVLQFAGSVGTGFDQAEVRRVRAILDELAADSSPFAARLPPIVKGAHWIRPELVVQVEFAEWTPEGRLRHPAYLGQRLDTDPALVVREPL